MINAIGERVITLESTGKPVFKLKFFIDEARYEAHNYHLDVYTKVHFVQAKNGEFANIDDHWRHTVHHLASNIHPGLKTKEALEFLTSLEAFDDTYTPEGKESIQRREIRVGLGKLLNYLSDQVVPGSTIPIPSERKGMLDVNDQTIQECLLGTLCKDLDHLNALYRHFHEGAFTKGVRYEATLRIDIRP